MVISIIFIQIAPLCGQKIIIAISIMQMAENIQTVRKLLLWLFRMSENLLFKLRLCVVAQVHIRI